MGVLSRLDRMLAGRSRKVVVAIALIALLALPMSNVLANHVFSDVPTSAFYHDSVTAVANAGVTAGCGGTKYCPNNAVTRGQMAVFLDRLGNLSGEKGPVVDALTALGQILIADVEDFTLVGGASSECETSTNVPPIVPDEIFAISIVHQLRDAPVQTDLVNVQIEDPDLTDEEYDVCFRTVDGTNLTGGVYKTNYWAGLTIGSGVFAGGAESAAIAKIRQGFSKH